MTSRLPQPTARRSSVTPMSDKPPMRASYAPPSSSSRAQTMSSRMSDTGSVSGASNTGNVKNIRDTRDLMDKHVRHRLARQLHQYLISTGEFPSVTLPSCMAPPSIAIFRQMFTSIVREFMADYQATGDHREMCDVVKRIGYPYTLSPSSLQTVNAKHAWPSVLGMLVWLIDQMQLVAEIKDFMPDQTEQERARSVAADDYKIESFRLHCDQNAGKSPPNTGFAQLKEHLKARMMSMSGHSKVELSEALDEAERLTERIEQLRAEHRDAGDLRNRLHRIALDKRDAFTVLHRDTQQVDEVRHNIERTKHEMETLETKREHLTTAVATIREQIANQGMAPSEARQLNMDKTRAEASLAALQAELNDARLQRDAFETHTSQAMVRLETLHRRLCHTMIGMGVGKEEWVTMKPHSDEYDSFISREPLIEQVKSETETKLKMLHEKELELNENCVKSAETTMQQAEDKIGVMSKIDLLKKTESKDMKNYGVQLENAKQQFLRLEIALNQLKNTAQSTADNAGQSEKLTAANQEYATLFSTAKSTIKTKESELKTKRGELAALAELIATDHADVKKVWEMKTPASADEVAQADGIVERLSLRAKDPRVNKKASK